MSGTGRVGRHENKHSVIPSGKKKDPIEEIKLEATVRQTDCFLCPRHGDRRKQRSRGFNYSCQNDFRCRPERHFAFAVGNRHTNGPTIITSF